MIAANEAVKTADKLNNSSNDFIVLCTYTALNSTSTTTPLQVPISGTEWPILCWCPFKKQLTH